MKRQYLQTIVLSVVTFVIITMLVSACSNHIMQDDDCVEILNSAADDMHDMNYTSAKLKLARVLSHTGNRMHRMSANLLMMRICEMTGENKEFFDYRSDAEKCMHVLKEEEPYIDGHLLVVWHYLQHSYYSVSATYYSRSRQDVELREMIDSLAAHQEWADGDTLAFNYKITPTKLVEGRQMVELADQLCDSCLYDEALAVLAEALHQINVHHLIYNKNVSQADTLTLTGMITDSISKEMRWIDDPLIVAVPEWMALVREQLSIVYGAMGDKLSSNYNRNIYFDILDATRQNVQMESREETLKAQSRFMNLLIVLLVSFALVVCLLIYTVTKRIGRNSRDKSQKLKLCLDICGRMVNNEDVEDDIMVLLPHVGSDWTQADVKDKSIKPYEREMLSLLQVFHGWIAKNTELYDSLMEQKEDVESAIYLEQRRIDDNKRRHTDRAAAISIVQGITPFLERALHQVEKGRDYLDRNLLREYVEKINGYNDVLGHWVKVRQGSVTLNVENFALEPLLDTLRKGHRSFDNKNITFSINTTDAVVKADKALTLFMMNTLLDNARKYTPEGGEVSLIVQKTDAYVEVSVSDNGKGLSTDDQDKINNMKVYDSSQIGLDNDADGAIRKNKGFGFGLMNCRGIIEKYRKAGRMFDVCHFGVESTVGSGSRFFFRLPKGVVRTFCILFAFAVSTALPATTVSNCLDSIYDANVVGDYARAVQFADSAIRVLNGIHQQRTGHSEPQMQLYSASDEFAELQWFAEGVEIDYNLIIQLRNEVSLAALSLADKQLYVYNNEAFLRLSKQTSLDPDLEAVCRRLAQQNANKNLVLSLSFVIIIVALAVFALLYYRHTLLPIFNMRLLVEFLNRMFSADAEHFLSLLHQGISGIQPIDAVCVTLTDGRRFCHGEGECRTHIPLSLVFEGERRDVGVMDIAIHGSMPSADGQLILNFIAQFVSIRIFFASAKVEEQQNIIELLEDQRFAAETEQQRLHVQNMVMDNCLSTIKHETMYYPNRILQLLDKSSDLDVTEVQDVLKYYRDVFTLLSENANRQLSRSIIKLQVVSLADVAEYARKSFEKQNRKLMLPVEFAAVGDISGNVRADSGLLQYLLDTLLSQALECKSGGKIELNFEKSERFVKFALADSRDKRTEEECSRLFYPDSMHYDPGTDTLVGAQYLIAKQIIRAHDSRLGHPGCRIYAEADKVVFTLPAC